MITIGSFRSVPTKACGKYKDEENKLGEVNIPLIDVCWLCRTDESKYIRDWSFNF